jgi:hypothetical protein
MKYRHLLGVIFPCLVAAIAAYAPESHAEPGAVRAEVHAGGPLSQWMAGNATPALARGDFARLTHVYERIAELAPREPGFERWKPIAKDGAAAAARKDLVGARKACKDCHEAMRADYRKRFPHGA